MTEGLVAEITPRADASREDLPARRCRGRAVLLEDDLRDEEDRLRSHEWSLYDD